MPIEFTDYDVWSFKRDDADKWHWQRTSPEGEVLIAAVTGFATMEECIEDARRRGYRSAADAVSDAPR